MRKLFYLARLPDSNSLSMPFAPIARFLLLASWVYAVFLLGSCEQRSGISQKPVNTQFKQAVDARKEYYILHPQQLYEAMHYYDSCYSHVNEPGFEDVFLYYTSMSGICYYAEQFSMAVKYADTLEQKLSPHITATPRNLEMYVSTLFIRGDYYMALGKYQEAFSNYFKAKNILSKNSSGCVVANYSYRIGMVMYGQKKYEEAKNLFIDCFYRMYECSAEEKASIRQQALLDNVGLCHYHLGNNDSALYYFEKTIEFIDAHQQDLKEKYVDADFVQIAKGVVYGNMAKVYRRQKEYNKSEELYRKSIVINLKKGYDVHDAKLAMLELASLYEETKDADALKNTLVTFGAVLDTLPNVQQIMTWHQLYSDYYQMKKDYASAFYHLNQLNHLRDSLKSTEVNKNQPDIQQQFGYYEKQYENELLKKDNEEKQFSLTVTALLAALIILGSFFVYYAYHRSKKDVHVLRQLNEQINTQKTQLESALSALEENNHAKDRILHVVAHDLRNPISAISSISMLLNDEFSETQKNGKELAALINTTCGNALELIGDLLETSNSQLLPVEPEPVDVNTLLTNCVNLLRFKADEKGQTIELNKLSSSRTIFADREKMWRMLNNLIVNALKFSPDKSVVKVTAEAKDNYLLLSVKDFGIGIPADMQPKIFDMFTSAKRSGTKGEKSFGLGLSIVKQFVTAHNGRVWVESEPGKGAIFFVELPWQ